MACCMMAAIAICGCVQTAVNDNQKAGEGGNAYQRHKCGHIHVKSVLGLTDEVLADTNRFLLGAMLYGHQIKLDKPLLGCTEARVYLDRMELPRLSAVRTKPHQLRSVELKRVLSEQATSDTLIREAKGTISEIAEWLDVEPPDVELADVGEWRKSQGRFMMGSARTSVCFDLADGQDIVVRLIEANYVVRDGVPLLVSPAAVEVDITYNNKLCCVDGVCDRRKETNPVKVEKELDIGDDCSDKLAKAIRVGIDRYRECTAQRKRGGRNSKQGGQTMVGSMTDGEMVYD